MSDLIERQVAIDAAIEAVDEWDGGCSPTRADMIADAINNTVPSAQREPCEDAEFWRKRAEEYRDQCIALTVDMAKGVKFDSMCFNEDGIVFKRGQPEQRWVPVDLRNNSPEENKAVLLGVRFRDDFKYFVTSRQDYNYWTGLGREIKGELRWQPLPEPYREEGELKE